VKQRLHTTFERVAFVTVFVIFFLVALLLEWAALHHLEAIQRWIAR